MRLKSRWQVAVLFLVSLVSSKALFAAPSITSLSPTTGAVGASVTIAGTNFGSTQGTSTVKFNATAVTAITSWSATSIVATVPTGATTGNVVVTVSGVASNGSSFTVVAAPSITSLSPTSGAIAAVVTITGTNFGSTQGTSTVKFNGTTATVTTWSATSIKTTVPTGATTGNVVVHASGVDSNGSNFTVFPSISSLSPTTGAVGASVTITGTNFGSTQGTSTVKFNTTAATAITSWSATSIVLTVPTGATTGNVVVTVGGNASNGVSFTVVAAPSITTLSVTSGAVGASVTITGTNFGSTQGTSTVKFNGTTATATSWSATSIVTTVPTGATTGTVVVHASGVDSNGSSFTVLPTPSITSLSPTTGAVGASVTITGTNFGATQGTSTVKFNTTTATTISSWSATSIVATVPTGATTGNVVVSASGVNSNGVSFTVVATPSITSLSVTSGAVGTAVTITGTNFGSTQGTSTVSFNGTTATTITSWSATSIVTAVPTGATTGNVVVNASGVNSNGVAFTVFPSISSLSLTSGAVGASVTITGANFGSTQGTSTVKFNTTAATTITSWSATSIVATVPTGATTGSVVVTVGGHASNGISFTVVAAPSITSLSPTSGAVGASVTITGTNFGSTQGTGSVSFSGTIATITSWSATSIVTAVPTGATTGNLVVNASGVNSNGVSFAVVAAPSITSVSPSSGAVGASVTIAGMNFGSTQGTSTVKFNTTAATTITSWSATSIVVTVPTGATTGNVVVNASGVNSNGVSFTVVVAPSITSVSPTTGAVGASVTIAGTNFGSTQGTSTVKFNTTAATTITSWSATSIVVTVPTGAATGNVVVNASGVNSNGVSFTVVAAPSITSVSPTSGAVGTSVTITGTNFGSTQGTGTVAFGGVTATTITSWSATSIVATVPTGAATGNVVVNASGVNSNGVSFTVVAAPSITSVSPTTGAVGALVTIAGTNFGSTQGTSTVKFNSTAATITSWSATSIVTTVPTGATTGNIVVNASGVNSNGVSFTVVAAPSITSVSPTSGAVGTSVTITGTNFGSTQGTGTVAFGGVTATTITSWSATSIVTTVPTAAATGNVVVNASGVNSNGVSFTVVAAPNITSVSPTSGAVGASVTITGTNFGSTQGTSTVKFNSTAATITSWSATSIVATVPTGAATGNVVVNASGVNSNGVSFTVVVAPSITSVSPTSGAVGASVTITGTNFGSTQGTSTVKFNSTAATITSWSATSIVATVPTGAATGNVVVNASGVNSNGVSFTVVSAPSITSVSPTSGAVGASVTITGTNFGSTQGAATVAFGGVTATTITSWSASSIVATVPTAAATGNVVVNASGVNSNGVSFTVVVAPSVTNLSPTSGAVGASVTITGTNFGAAQGTSTVTFNGTAGTPTSWSATAIVLPVPSGATTGTVVVTVNGQASNASSFTVLPTPSITSLSPTSATIGSVVTITGTNFGSTQGASAVTFNGIAGVPTSWSSTSVVVPVPSGATTGNVVATVNGVASNAVLFTVITVSLPPVAQVQPANGASGFPENGRIVVRLAQSVQPAVIVPGTVTLFQGATSVAGAMALSNDGLSVTFTPSTNLAPNTIFTVQVTNVIGNQTTPEFQSTFTTSSTTDTNGPTIVQTSPQSSNTGVPISAPIVVQFSEPMDPATLTPQAFTVTDNVTGNSVPGMVQVDPTGTTASFVAQPFLGVGRAFSVQLRSTIEDSSGNGLTGGGMYYGFTTAFTADTTAPQVLGTSPSSGATAVPLNALIVLEFSKPLDVLSVSNGLQVVAGGQPIPGAVALSNSNQQITFTPLGGLTANTTYSIVTTSQIMDVGGLVLANPGTISITTGTASDTTTPSVTVSSPTSSETGVPINGVVQVEFSKPVDPWTVTSLTFELVYSSTGVPIPGTVSASPSGLTATYTTSSPLESFTNYYVEATSGITDMEGHGLSNFAFSFTTGVATDTSAPTVLTVSPANSASAVPVNVRVDFAMSAPLDPASVNGNAVVVSSGGVAVPGTVSLSSSGTTLTFVPTNLLAVSSTYTVTASGFTDQSSNTVVPFTSGFTTGTSGVANTTAPAVVTVSPANAASAVATNATIVLTFNETIDGTTVNDTTVPIAVSGFSGVLAGSYSLDTTGKIVTFTPLSPLPGNATVTVQVNSGLLDLSGNPATSFSSSFTTGTGSDTAAPVIINVTPSNGTTAVGTSAVVVLTFSKSLNPGTLNSNNLGLLANGTAIGVAVSTSADNRVVTLNSFGLPASSTITVLATSAVTDLSGNSLANFQSEFMTGPGATAPVPTVVSQRPGNGATGVPQNASVVLYINEPMIATSVQAALQVSQNGVLVSGTTQVTDNGQVVQFTPSTQWPPSALVQVFLTPTAQSTNAGSLSSYQSSFTTVSDPSTTAPVLVSTNPVFGVSGVPTNVVVDFAFNEALDPSALTPTSVTCYQNGVWLQTAVGLLNGGTLLQVVPRLPLVPNESTNCLLGSGIQGLNGLALSALSGNAVQFSTGAGPDAVVPTIVATSPPSGSSNVGDNANVQLLFSKPINPLTVNASTIQLSGAGITEIPDSISFSINNQTASLVPHAPLPDATLMTLSISGVSDVAGNVISPQTTQFTTGTGPAVVLPLAVEVSPLSQATKVPLNTVVALRVSIPISPGSLNSNSFFLSDDTTGQSVVGTLSLSTDGQTITFVPAASLAASRGYHINFEARGITDMAGNPISCMYLCSPYFTTGTTSSTNAPQVVGVSPANGTTAIPVNAQVVIQFNEPVDGAKLAGVVLSGGSGTVNVSQNLTNGNQNLTLVPSAALSPGTTYTVTVAGIQDISGNTLTSPPTVSFTTGSGGDLIAPAILSSSPSGNATNVATTAVIQAQFSKAVDPLTVTASTFYVDPYYTSIPAVGTISVSPNGQTATLTPNQPLDSQTFYVMQLTSGILDLEGHALPSFGSYFTTATGTGILTPVVDVLLPASASVGISVTIDGTYFGTSQGTSSVTFNGVPATTTSWSDTQIVALVPSGATTGNIVVTVNGTASNGRLFVVTATPGITGISPGSGPVGTPVTITGTNLGGAQDSITVYFSGYPSTPTSANGTSIVTPVPASAPTGNLSVSVITNGYGSNAISFTVIPTPNIAALSPTSGVTGTPVYIYGSSFGSTQGSSAVLFNGVAAASITSWSDGSILAVPPSNVTTGPITVIENSVPSNNNYVFTVSNPAIGSLSPPAAAPGAVITVNGSGFALNNTQVLFNGIAAAISTYGTNSLTVQVPTNATSGPVIAEVGSITSNSVQFTVEPTPTITAITPSIGPFGSNGQAAPVTITGSGFGATQSNSTVSFFQSNTAPTIVSWSDTSISLWIPTDAATGPFFMQIGGITAPGQAWFYVNTATQLTDSLGNQSQYDMTMQGGLWFLSTSEGPGCSTCSARGNITNVSDAFGNVLASTDDLSNTTTYTYDSSNNMTSASKPLNVNTTATTSYTYNSFGEALTVTDALGNTTTNTYDANGNLLTVTAPAPNSNTSASVTQLQYDPKGELTQITDPKNNITTLTYTSVGLIATIKDAQNNITTYQYDTRGNRTAVIDPINGASHPTSFTYDIMNRLTAITYPDGSAVGFGYDTRGRRITSTDQNQKTTNYAYDDADRLVSVTDPANNMTQYAYDTEDNLLSITDANNHATSFAYNARGWVTQTTFPSTLAESYTYDLVGHLLSKKDRKNQTIQYVYDALYRMTQKTYPDTTNVEYVYDLVGKVQQVSDPTGTYGFAYDNMGRLVGTTTQYTFVTGTYSNSYTYDAASNRASLTAPDGSISTYGYDTLNRLNGLANSWAGSFGFGYDALSRRTQLTRPNGVNTNYNYDSLSHLLSVLHQSGNTTLDGASYAYDPAGNRTSKGNDLNGITSNYTYDPLYELTQVTQGVSTTETYSYDAVGNRLSSSGVPTYSYNPSNELTSDSSGSYAYDANGNTLADPSGKSYSWDFENRLTQAVVPGTNGGTTTFKYDPFGRRIQKSGPLGTTDYLYDGVNLLEEIDNSGNVLARYTQGASVDEELSELRANTTSYYDADGLGSITSLSNGAGALANTYTYDSFGKLTASTGTLTNPFQFTGREFDQETGTYYYRMRYYDSNSGRFISEDPAAFDLQWPNLFSYVKNSPTGLIDPSGLSPQVLGPFICTWCWEFNQGAAWMWEGYERMRNMKWRNSDKYFHCMANCRATDSGSGGAAAAKIFSFFRTDVRSRWTEPTDWRNDKVANQCGQKGGDCDKTCAPFLPRSSPGKPPFPGWPNQ